MVLTLDTALHIRRNLLLLKKKIIIIKDIIISAWHTSIEGVVGLVEGPIGGVGAHRGVGKGGPGGVGVGHRTADVSIANIEARAGLRVLHYLRQDHQARILRVFPVTCWGNKEN